MELPDIITPRINSSSTLGQALISMFKSVEFELVAEGNKEPPTTVLTNILQDYLEATDGDAP